MCAKSSNGTKKECRKIAESNKNKACVKEKQKSNKQSTIQNFPIKPLSPFKLYLENKMASKRKAVNFNKITFEKNCRKEWKSMSDKEKLYWVNCAFEQEIELKQNMIFTSPTRNSCRSILTQKKPSLPKQPMTEDEREEFAYDLFRRAMLSIEDVKKLKPKERNTYITQLWHKCKPLEKKEYDKFFEQMFLPQNIDKTKFKIRKEEDLSTIREENDNNEPEVPPSCASKLFVKNYYDLYPHSDDAMQVWEKLSAEDKQVYNNLLNDMNEQYSIDYQNFLEGYNLDDFYEHMQRVAEANKI